MSNPHTSACTESHKMKMKYIPVTEASPGGRLSVCRNRILSHLSLRSQVYRLPCNSVPGSTLYTPPTHSFCNTGFLYSYTPDVMIHSCIEVYTASGVGRQFVLLARILHYLLCRNLLKLTFMTKVCHGFLQPFK